MWLVSVTVWAGGDIVPTERWMKATDAVTTVGEVVDAVLLERGDTRRQRAFRMCATYCRHRALSDAEYASLPAAWHDRPPVDIAGGPVEILWKTDAMPHSASVEPCLNPRWEPMYQILGMETGNPDLKFPHDCGACPPCVARATA